MSDVKHRPISATVNNDDWIILQSDGAGLGDEKRVSVSNLVGRRFATISEFTAAGGAEANSGQVWIDGKLYWSDGDSIARQIPVPISDTSVGILGDSRCSIGYSEINRNGGSAPSYSIYHTANSWLMWAAALVGVDIDIKYQGGVSGEKVANILARIDTAIASGVKVMFVMADINDLSANATPIATIKATLTQIYERLAGAGIYVVAVSDMAYGTSVTSDYISQQSALMSQWKAEYFRANPTVGEFVDITQATTDIATGYAITGALYDGLHQSNVGAYLTGKFIAAHGVMTRLFPKKIIISSARFNPTLTPGCKQLNPNPLFLGSPVAGVAPNYTVGNSGTGSSSTNTVVQGKFGLAQRMTITAVAENDSYVCSTDNVSANVASSDTLQANALIRVVGTPTNLKEIKLWLYAFTADGQVYWVGAWNHLVGGTGVNYTEAFEAFAMTTKISNTIACNNVFARVEAIFSGAGSAVIEVEQLAINRGVL